jgi:hypothetical protein
MAKRRMGSLLGPGYLGVLEWETLLLGKKRVIFGFDTLFDITTCVGQ